MLDWPSSHPACAASHQPKVHPILMEGCRRVWLAKEPKRQLSARQRKQRLRCTPFTNPLIASPNTGGLPIPRYFLQLIVGRYGIERYRETKRERALVVIADCFHWLLRHCLLQGTCCRFFCFFQGCGWRVKKVTWYLAAPGRYLDNPDTPIETLPSTQITP